ncbi:MAG: endonuclease NucS domain-containing protein [Pseudorhodobacter sp.]
MRKDYKYWLAAQGLASNTQVAQLHRVAKVEEFYGSLEDIVAKGEFESLISELTYSTADERQNRPNPSRIPFQGNARNNLASYRDAAKRYQRFLLETGGTAAVAEEVPIGMANEPDLEVMDPPEKHRLALERDMQAALRRDIASLELGLRIIDEGMERGVASGFIDILCEDDLGVTVVIELKAGTTDARVIGQVLGYMGDLLEDEPDQRIRGIIVAHDFDKRTRAAAKAVPNLGLASYSIQFSFQKEG